ncbi:hypothetical protein BGW80DRAFT_1248624 [Lactifluus volemus]|nr:hypothetical protein BGW80DRAFT_1248624 [Lactifluus volemus]
MGKENTIVEGGGSPLANRPSTPHTTRTLHTIYEYGLRVQNLVPSGARPSIVTGKVTGDRGSGPFTLLFWHIMCGIGLRSIGRWGDYAGVPGRLEEGARLSFTAKRARGIAKYDTVGKNQAQAKAGAQHGDPQAESNILEQWIFVHFHVARAYPLRN